MIDFILERYNYWIFIVLMMMGLYIVISRGNLVKKIIGLNVFQTSVFIFYISIGKTVGGTAPILMGDAAHGGHHGDEGHGGGHEGGHHDDAHNDDDAHSDSHVNEDHSDAAHHDGDAHHGAEEAALHAAPEKHVNTIGDLKIDPESLKALNNDGASVKDLHAAAGGDNKIGNDLSSAVKNDPVDEQATEHEGFHEADPHDGAHGADLHGAEIHGDAAHGLDPSLAEVVYTNPLPHVLILTAIVVGVATTAVGLALAVRIREAYGSIEEDELIAEDLAAEFGGAAKAGGA